MTISLPLSNDEAQAPQLDLNAPTIVLIEDNTENANVILKALKHLDITRVTAVEQGQLGLDICLSNPPNLILLDLNLSDVSGKEILRELKSNLLTKTIPVIVVSADIFESTVSEVKQLGATAFHPKPLNISIFLNQVRNALRLDQAAT